PWPPAQEDDEAEAEALLVAAVELRQLGQHPRIRVGALLDGGTRRQPPRADRGMRVQRLELLLLGQRARSLVGRRPERVLALRQPLDEGGAPLEELRELVDAPPRGGLAELGVEDVGRDHGANLRAWTRCSRAISSSSTRTSAPARTTWSPPTYSVLTRWDAERTRPATGSAAPPSSSASVGQTARSAHFPGSIEPMSLRPSNDAPPRVASRSASRTVIASGPPRPRATSSACFPSRKRSPRSFDAEPSTPRPTRTPARISSCTGATPAPSRRFEVGQCATPVPESAKRATSAVERWTQCA